MPAVRSLRDRYRGEIGRLTAYRQRMDSTTNWAVTITSALIAFSLGNSTLPHYFFLLIALLQLFFCGVEARRHVYYSLVRYRCRLMERGFYANLLDPSLPAVAWRRPLRASYMPDVVTMPVWRSFVGRLKRLYVYMLLATYVGWTFKLIVIGGAFQWITFLVVSVVVLSAALWIIVFVRDVTLDV